MNIVQFKVIELEIDELIYSLKLEKVNNERQNESNGWIFSSFGELFLSVEDLRTLEQGRTYLAEFFSTNGQWGEEAETWVENIRLLK